MSALELSETLSERSRTVCHISLDLMSRAELSQRRLAACESESRSLTALMRPLFHNRLSICSSARSHSRSSLRHARVIYKSAWTYSTTREVVICFMAPSVNDSVGRDDQSFQSVFYKTILSHLLLSWSILNRRSVIYLSSSRCREGACYWLLDTGLKYRMRISSDASCWKSK